MNDIEDFYSLNNFVTIIKEQSQDLKELVLFNLLLNKLIPKVTPLPDRRVLLEWNNETDSLFFENVPYKDRFYFWKNTDTLRKEETDLYQFTIETLIPFINNKAREIEPRVLAKDLPRL